MKERRKSWPLEVCSLELAIVINIKKIADSYNCLYYQKFEVIYKKKYKNNKWFIKKKYSDL